MNEFTPAQLRQNYEVIHGVLYRYGSKVRIMGKEVIVETVDALAIP